MKKFTRFLVGTSALSLVALVYASLTAATIIHFDSNDCAVDPADYATHIQPLNHNFGVFTGATKFNVEYVGWSWVDPEGAGNADLNYTLKLNGTTIASGTFAVPPAKPFIPNVNLLFPISQDQMHDGENHIDFKINVAGGAGCWATVHDEAFVTKATP